MAEKPHRSQLVLDRIFGWPAGLVTAHDTPLSRKASDHLPLTALVDLMAKRSIFESAFWGEDA